MDRFGLRRDACVGWDDHYGYRRSMREIAGDAPEREFGDRAVARGSDDDQCRVGLERRVSELVRRIAFDDSNPMLDRRPAEEAGAPSLEASPHRASERLRIYLDRCESPGGC
jgi:hypothetical protein